MYPADVISKIRSTITPDRKFAFLSAFGTGLLVHFYRLTNHLLTWDSVYNFYDPQNKVGHGRCFLTLGCGISSYYDIQWIIGLFSLLWLSLTCVCLAEIFALRRKGLIFLTSAITVTFPSVAGTFAYMYTADGYFLAQLTATLAVLVTIRFRKGWIGGLFLLAFSYGSYQAYVSYAVMLILTWLVLQIIRKGIASEGSTSPAASADPAQTAATPTLQVQTARLLLMGICGTVLYFIANKVLVLLQHETLAAYNGIGSMSVPGPSECVVAVRNSLIDFAYFFFGPLDKGYLFKGINILLFVVLITLVLIAWSRMKVCRIKGILLTLLCFAAMPFACFMIYFVSSDVRYYMLMEAGLSLIYLLPLLLYETLHLYDDDEPRFVGKCIISWLAILAVIASAFYFIIVDNISYLYMTTSNEKTFYLLSRMAGVMEQTEGYESANRLAVIGHFDGYDDIDLNLPPAMAGVRDSYIVSESAHYTAMFDTYYGIRLDTYTRDEITSLQKESDIMNMPCWPAPGSVKVKDHTVVIKISDEK
ncbi:MAG: hypothetical protein E7300_11115 [Lachnospiraceae bacterium]|nr:hypothetical protein [Lachnospiraceae bacterium]